MKKFQTFGVSTPEESDRERRHKALACRAAAEGIVLLKNDGVLPLTTKKVALYGPGSRRTVKGGSGSGDVHERHSVTIEEGLKNAGFTFPTTLWMDRFEKKYEDDVAAWRRDVEEKIRNFTPIQTMKMFDVIHEKPMPFPTCTPVLEDELTDKTDTAIYVLSRQAGEGQDRRVEKGDYLLSDTEEESLKRLSDHYKKLILVLNCGGALDLSALECVRIDAVLFYGQGGMEGGSALADILTGQVSPSGRLTDTWAVRYEDYPSAGTFSYRNGDLENEEYCEGIYVGYRWFEKKNIRPRFPFGFGLSYTTFACSDIKVKNTQVRVTVTNTGTCAGKEVLLLFVQKPAGKLDHEVRALAAFAKTKCLSPGESETLTLSFSWQQIASFDEERSAFILEDGPYALFLGETFCGSVTVEKEKILQQVRPIVAQKEYAPSGEVFSEKVQTLLQKMTAQDKIDLVTGGGYSVRCYNNVMGACGRTCTGLLKKGVPNIVMADGPAGINVNQSSVVMKDGTPRFPDGLPEDWRWGWLKHFERFVKAKPGKGRAVYCYMTAWPSETVLAQSWNCDLLEEIGRAIGAEMLEIGVSVWLAPGMNIHRNPLCGRNFEYYSEDPLLTGKMAAAITRGVQSCGGVGVTVKHFCCNNQEDNRTGVSANVSQRALREIYLRGFATAVAEGRPWCVMSSYNRVNGRYVCNARELCTDVLRREWGFQGVVMSDWNATDQCSPAEAVNAGNDLIMPGNARVRKALRRALKAGTLRTDALNTSAGRVLEMVFQSATCKDFRP